MFVQCLCFFGLFAPVVSGSQETDVKLLQLKMNFYLAETITEAFETRKTSHRGV